MTAVPRKISRKELDDLTEEVRLERGKLAIGIVDLDRRVHELDEVHRRALELLHKGFEK